MSENIRIMSFVGEFKKVSREEWIAKANADLKGKINAEEVMYKVEEGISLSPFLFWAHPCPVKLLC